jgi:hypothetical protein
VKQRPRLRRERSALSLFSFEFSTFQLQACANANMICQPIKLYMFLCHSFGFYGFKISLFCLWYIRFLKQFKLSFQPFQWRMRGLMKRMQFDGMHQKQLYFAPINDAMPISMMHAIISGFCRDNKF